jgi:hypothetical protein
MNEMKRWAGIDTTVIEKVATEAGHPPREPYLNTEHGDLLLFLFLLAGAIGGFIIGYAFRALFPPRGVARPKRSDGRGESPTTQPRPSQSLRACHPPADHRPAPPA